MYFMVCKKEKKNTLQIHRGGLTTRAFGLPGGSLDWVKTVEKLTLGLLGR